MNEISSNIKKLENANILQVSEINGAKYHHLTTPTTIEINENCLKQLSKAYDSKNEIGGFLIAKVCKKENSSYLIFESFHDIPNKSDTPWKSYSPCKTDGKNEYTNVIEEYLKHGYIPFRIHSHPTYKEDFVKENMEFLYQLNTSERDQVTSLTHKNIDDIKLRLPDVLMVGRETLDSLFIGFYGGLICPPDFTEQKRSLQNKATEKFFDSISKITETRQGKIFAGLSILGILYFAIKHPKTTLLFGLAGAITIPAFIYEQKEGSIYFGITSNNKFILNFPEVNLELMESYERKIYEVKISLDKKP